MQTNYRVRKQTSGFLQNEGGAGEERQDGDIFLKSTRKFWGVMYMFIILFVVVVSRVSNVLNLENCTFEEYVVYCVQLYLDKAI